LKPDEANGILTLSTVGALLIGTLLAVLVKKILTVDHRCFGGRNSMLAGLAIPSTVCMLLVEP